MDTREKVIVEMLRIRISQIIINEKYKKNEFKIPIHLALGHEAIAVALHEAFKADDKLVCSHRNVHYNLAFADSPRGILDEYLLKDVGLDGGRHGSMNLSNSAKGIVYTSNILGNNLSVAAGLSLSMSINKPGESVTYVVSGDGAMEEGAFYESLEMMKSLKLPSIIIIENNDWSLATRTEERRCEINIEKFTGSLGVGYTLLKGNDIFHYIDQLKENRERVIKERNPVCIEVKLSTLGDWRQKSEKFPEGKYINYHAGPAPTIDYKSIPIIEKSVRDPAYVISQLVGEEYIENLAKRVFSELKEILL